MRDEQQQREKEFIRAKPDPSAEPGQGRRQHTTHSKPVQGEYHRSSHSCEADRDTLNYFKKIKALHIDSVSRQKQKLKFAWTYCNSVH